MIISTTTLSLYIGQKEMISLRFPMETKISIEAMEDEQDTLPQLVHQTAELYGMVFDKEATYHLTYIGGVYKDNMVSVYQPKIDTISSSCGIYLITLDDYNRIEGTAERLKADEILAFSSSKNLGVSEIRFGNLKYQIKTELSQLTIQSKSALSSETRYFFVFPTQEDIDNILAELLPSENRFSRTYCMMFDVSGTQETTFNAELQNLITSNFSSVNFENVKTAEQNDNYTYGGFLFIGILLSLLFIIFLTLVIYYKQITEGYNDRYNFEVMQKVGLDRKEVSAIVHKEIRIMFFLPLLVAVVHLVFSLYAITMLLATLGLTNIWVLLLCAGTITLLFVLIYLVMYISTARIYCKIVTL